MEIIAQHFFHKLWPMRAHQQKHIQKKWQKCARRGSNPRPPLRSTSQEMQKSWERDIQPLDFLRRGNSNCCPCCHESLSGVRGFKKLLRRIKDKCLRSKWETYLSTAHFEHQVINGHDDDFLRLHEINEAPTTMHDD